MTYGDGSGDFDAQLEPAEDVPVSAGLSSLLFNSIVFLILMASYECLRRLLPTVYSSRKRLDRIHLADATPESTHPSQHHPMTGETPYQAFPDYHGQLHEQEQDDDLRERPSGLQPLPDDRPLDWVFPVFGVPWKKVRQIAGLDGYFFLRYIRMNVRITAVSTFWFFVILAPIYATGGGSGEYVLVQQEGGDGADGAKSKYVAIPETATGWYYFSAANLPVEGWRIWIPCLFCYLFSAFITFVIKQEYRHFLEIRQDFLARGAAHVNPQHHCEYETDELK